jgi:hypothetical protein
MEKSKLSLSQVFSVVLAAATVISAPATLARSPVPFKATLAINETIQPEGIEGCLLTGHISGRGQASHMGNVTVTSTDCVNPTDTTGTTLAFGSKTVVITAANGDEIFAEYGGTFTIQGEVGAIIGGYHIIGGTGRFSGASGDGALQGVEDVITKKGQIQLNGTLIY